jgi:tetratricopeptide (TPR) repeat protein
VRRLAEGLRRAGHQPWLIEDELRVGRSALEVLQHGLRDSDFVVACLSREALRSGWQEAELRLILEGLPQERADRLIPVRFEEVELPASLRTRASIDVLEERWDEGVARLASLLRDSGDNQPGQPLASAEDAEPRNETWVGTALSSCSHEAPQLMRAATIFAPGPLPSEWLVRAGRLLTLEPGEPGSDESRMELERFFSTGLTLYQPEQSSGAELLERALVLARSQQAPPAEVSHALSEALRAAEAGGSTGNAARAALLLGSFLGSRGAWESAQEHFERALRLSKQSGDDRLVAEAYRLLGDASLHGSHYEDARLNYAEAIRRYDALRFLRKAAKTRLLLLTMLLQLGRVQEIDSLLPPLRKSLDDGLFTDMQERADAELALRLADSLRGPQPQGDTP